MRRSLPVPGLLVIGLLAGGCVTKESPDEAITAPPPPSVETTVLDIGQDPDRDGFSLNDDFCPDAPGPISGCPDEDDDGFADILQTTRPNPTTTAPTGSTNTTVSPTTAPLPLRLKDSFFAADAAGVVTELESGGYTVIDYRVCSGSVLAGQVRQIIRSSDGAILLDKDGVTETGDSVLPGIVIEVKIGSGQSCG